MTWTLTGAPPSGSSLVQVRATGVIPSSEFASSGLDQFIYLANSSAVPIVNSSSTVAGTSGTPLSFTVTATQSPKTFSATGLPAGLSINSTTGVISGTPTGIGTYSVMVTVSNGGGSTVSALTISIGSTSSTRFAPASTSAANRLLNLSSRAELSGSQTLIAGFVISDTGTKAVLLRAVGPGLKEFNVPGVMATPELQIYSSTGALITQTSSWDSNLAATFAQVGAFSLTPGSADAALLTNLAPDSYTIHVFDPSGKGGVVLAEVYDASASPMTAAQRLINISARGYVSPGAGALIGGFVISGSSLKSVLIRGVGPGLSGFGVSDSIADPVLSVFDENGNLVAQNFSWSNQTITGSDQATIEAQDIMTADSSVGAFALSALNPDTALIANLPPGAYTFQVTSASNSTGEALGEVYELP
jgi:PKD repeat protein